MENKKNTALIRSECGGLMQESEEVKAIVIPDANIYETDDLFIVELDMPGTNKESISVSADNQILSVSSKTANESKSSKMLLNEIVNKDYQREFRLGKGININEISAEYKDGVLIVSLPKAENAKPRQIMIK